MKIFTVDISGIISTSKDEEEVDYQSRDDSGGSDYSESTEDSNDDEEESNESDYDDKRRKKREISSNALESFNYSRKNVEGRVSGKVKVELEREIAPSQLPSREDESETKASRFIPGDFMEMFSHMMFSPPPNKSESTATLYTNKINKKKYNNFQLWRVYIQRKSDISYLDELRMSEEGKKLHWLENPKLHSFTDVVVAPTLIESFKKFLTKGNIKVHVKLRNIQNAIKYENLRFNKREQLETEMINGHPLSFFRYHPSKDIHAYYNFIKRKYARFVELITLGFSFNSKPLMIVKVSAPRKARIASPQKPGVFILAGVSANLWLPVASSLYILHTLVTNLANNDSLGEYIRKYDWYVLALLNVDGYDYSMNYDRLWRKTRSEYSNTDDSSGEGMLSP